MGTSEFKTIQGISHRFSEEGYQADIHQCVLKDLQPGATYVYKVGDESRTDGVSERYAFKAGVPTRWVVYGGKSFMSWSLILYCSLTSIFRSFMFFSSLDISSRLWR